MQAQTIPLSELNFDQCALLLRWCRSHDWGQTVQVKGSTLLLWDEYTLPGNIWVSGWRNIDTLDQLWDFAGYEPEGIQEALDDLA